MTLLILALLTASADPDTPLAPALECEDGAHWECEDGGFGYNWRDFDWFECHEGRYHTEPPDYSACLVLTWGDRSCDCYADATTTITPETGDESPATP